MINTDHGGVCPILHHQIADIPAHVMAKSFVIIDEAHLVMRDTALVKKLLTADRVLGLSATFGEE